MPLLTPIKSISFTRWCKLLSGLVSFGIGVAFMKRANFGLSPWEVLNDGIAYHLGLMLGTASILVGIVVMLLWIPMQLRADIGTLFNMVLVGAFTNVGLNLIGAIEVLPLRMMAMLGSVLLVGLGSALYLGSQLGAGPRDGLMVGIHQRTGLSVRLTRTILELSVLLVGYLLNGTVGVGTFIFALSIGPVIQWMAKALGQTVSSRYIGDGAD